MARISYFGAGFGAGALTALIVAAAVRRGNTHAPDYSTPKDPASFFRHNPERLHLRRESSESAGDPARLASARTGAVAGFERQGGAPGGSTAAETLETPGRPGQQIDHSDASQPVKPATRALDLTGNK